MADEAQNPPENEDELVLTEEDQHEPETPEGEDETPENPEVNDEAEEEVFAFGDEITDEKPDDTPLIKQMRQKLRETQRELAEAKRGSQPEQAIEVGEKPTLAGCEYDEETYEAELDAWKERKARADAQVTERQKAAETQQKQWEEELQSVAKEKEALGRSDADEAFSTVRDTLGDQMNALLIHTVDKGNRARLIYALAKNPDKLASLASIPIQTNPIGFIKAVATLEKELKVVKRRKTTEPDTPSRGSASTAPVSSDKMLEKLEKEAARTGDRTKVIRYKRELREKGQ